MTVNRTPNLPFSWERSSRMAILKWLMTFSKPCVGSVPFGTLPQDFLSIAWTDGIYEVCEFMVTIISDGTIYFSIDNGTTWFVAYDAASSSPIPIGTIVWWTKNTVPSGWVLCDGSEYDRVGGDYEALYDTIGTAYGIGDNSTTFNVPDLRAGFIAGTNNADTGLDGALSTREPGDSSGAETHTIDTSELPAHVHPQGYGTQDLTGKAAATKSFYANASGGAWDNTGGDSTHENIHPSRVLRALIKY